MNHCPSGSMRLEPEYYMGYKRDSRHRIFVNKSLQLGKIKFFGFDMDYTLAMYKSPELEMMTFDMLKSRLVAIGYPKEFLQLKYDPTFPIRGLWIDRKFGNLLKMDNFGNILMAFHGLTHLSNSQVLDQYPNKFVKFDQTRIMVTNTLYNLPETYLIAAAISHFESLTDCVKYDTGFSLNNTINITFSSILEDIRDAMEFVHSGTALCQMILDNLEKFVERTPKLAEMLKHLKSNGAKVFLLTNSDYFYTEKICRYIFYCDKDENTEWTTYFDYIVTNARKPRFFFDGSLLRVVNRQTQKLEIGHHTGAIQPGVIYSGGSVETLSKLIGARGKDVLYFGDHIFGDILKSKKIVGWKTCLIVPEIENEIYVWKHKNHLFDSLQKLHIKLGEMYRNQDIHSPEMLESNKEMEESQNELRDICRQMEESYGQFGSLFRCGSRQTFFASQVLRYADLYTTSCLNLIYYPTSYMFQAPFMLMPHESTVSHRNVRKSTSDELVPVGLRRRNHGITDDCNGYECSQNNDFEIAPVRFYGCEYDDSVPDTDQQTNGQIVPAVPNGIQY